MPPLPRGIPTAALLLIALGLTGLLASQAAMTGAYQRAQAERVLRDYARFAAESYALRAAQRLFYAFGPALEAVARARRGAGAALPAPAALATGQPEPAAALLRAARLGFVLEPGGALRTGGADEAVLRPWIADTVAVDTRRYGPGWMFAVVTGRPAGEARLIVYRVERPSRTVVGLVVPPEALHPSLAAAARAPLLPGALAGGVPPDSLGVVIVRGAGDSTLFQSVPIAASPYAGRAPFGDYFGDLAVVVALHEASAGRLVIGGLPRSRLPFILTLFGLSVALFGAALVQLRRERELARLRADFVSGVSHELRTPLAQVRMFAETLLLGRVRSEEERRRSLEIVDQEARRLSHLVENLLHVSRTERLGLRLAPERGSLAPLLDDIAEAFRPLAASRRATIRVEAPADVVAPVDAAAFRQVLLNLLDNAVKYGPEGQVVRVRLGTEDGEARVAVEDEGPGIPAPDRERVWRRFFRLERDRGTAVAGTGIGLAVVRELVAHHGGRAWIEDGAAGEGGGARVVIALPLDRGEARA